MSKSLGNVYTISQLAEKGISPLAYKLFCFTAHYRTKLNFTFEGAMASQVALQRLYESYLKQIEGTEEIEDNIIDEYKNKFLECINDDMNMPAAMSVVWEVAKNNKKSKQFAELLLEFDKILGLNIENAKKYLEEDKDEIPDEIKELAGKRKLARENKQWEESDKLRDLIFTKGYIVKDTPQGIVIEKKKS